MNKLVLITVQVFWLGVFSLFAQDYKPYAQLMEHSAPVTFLSFSQDQQQLYSGDANGNILIWNISNGTLIGRFNGHSAKITHIDLSANKKLLLSASYDGSCKIWNIAKKQLVKTINNSSTTPYAQVNGNEPTFALFTPDNQSVLYGGYNMEITRSAINTNETSSFFQTNLGGITAGVLNNTGNLMAFGVNNQIYQLDLNTKEITHKLQNANTVGNYVCELNYLPNQDSLLAIWTYGGQIQIWNIPKNQVQYILTPTDQKGSSGFAFSANGRFLLTGNKGNDATLWDASNFQHIQTLTGHSSSVKALAFSLHDNLIATGGDDNNILLWKKEIITTLPTTSPAAEEVDESTDSILVAIRNRPIEVQESYTIQEDKIKLYIYDHDESDGDRISITFNNHLILSNYTLTKHKKIIELPVTQEENYLIVYAHNVGRIAPNTIAIDLESFDQRNSFRLRSDMNTSAAAKILLAQ